MKFKLLATVNDIEIYAPIDGFISFFSSPYTTHIKGAAVDISNSLDFGNEALSPVSGIIDRIIKVECDGGPYEKLDYIISLRSEVGSKYRIKLMHVRPLVHVNEKIEVADVIGRYIKTNYFAYHHIPHIHIEVCRDSTLRPSRAIELNLHSEFINQEVLRDITRTNHLRLGVMSVHENFIMCKVHNLATQIGILGYVSTGSLGLLNGELGVGIGYIGYLYLSKVPKPNSKLILCSKVIGYIKRVRKWYALALHKLRTKFNKWFLEKTSTAYLLPGSKELITMKDVVFLANGIKVIGIEALLSTRAQLKLILPPNTKDMQIDRFLDLYIVDNLCTQSH